MRPILALLLVLAGPTALRAQETCDVRSTVETVGDAAVFQQLMFCGDTDPVITLTCKPGANKVRARLPLGSPSKGPGEMLVVTFKIAGKPLKRRLRLIDEASAEITLEMNDPLWIALSASGTDIPAAMEDASTSIGIQGSSSKNFAEWKGMCGL
jgi:hypothetical protein